MATLVALSSLGRPHLKARGAQPLLEAGHQWVFLDTVQVLLILVVFGVMREDGHKEKAFSLAKGNLGKLLDLGLKGQTCFHVLVVT